MFKDITTFQGRWGRLNRLRFFGYTMLASFASLIVLFVSAFAFAIIGAENQIASILFIITQLLATLMIVWMGVCLYAKRCHDLDKSAWFVLTLLIPIANLVIYLYLLFAPGTKGANQYGPDPLDQV